MAATGTPIVIGTIGVYSGASPQSNADGQEIMKAWVASVNAKGGIAGHPVKLFTQDSAGNAARSLTGMKTLVEKDKIVAVVGHTETGAGWVSYIDGLKIPVVGGSPATVQNVYDPNFFNVGGNIISMFAGIMLEAKESGSKIGALYCAESPGCAAVGGIMKALSPVTGVDVSYTAGVAASAPDFTANCLAMKNAGVSAYNISTQSALYARIVGQCQQLGFKAPVIEVGASVGTNLQSETAFYGARFVDSQRGWFLNDTPAAKEFHDAIAKYEPSVGSSGLPLNSNGFAAWLSGKLLEAAVEASGATPTTEITPDVIRKGLYALKNETLGGLTQPLNYKEGQANNFNCYWPSTLGKDGKYAADSTGPVCPDAATDAAINAFAASLAPKK